MFLQVIWNGNLKQTSLIVSSTESYEDYPVIISLPLKEDISTNFVQNFIGFPDLELLYIEDKFLWLENYHLTKNILAFFNVLEYIELNEAHLHDINIFIQKQKLSTNDFENLGFQSPVKTVPRDLSTSPAFMKHFLNIADASKRLLRTTFSFQENTFSITVNKRQVKAQHFFYHLNSDRDRLRIKESLAYHFEDKPNFVSYISSLDVYIENTKPEQPVLEHNTIETPADDLEDNLENHLDEQQIIEESAETFFVENDIVEPSENLLKKEQTVNLDFHNFLNSATIVDNITIIEEDKVDNISKIEEVLEDFVAPTDNNYNDFFSTERTSEEFSLPHNSYSIEEYDNSVFIEQKVEADNVAKVDIDSVEEELTEEFLVEIENTLQKHEQSILENNNEDIEDDLEEDYVLQSISVDDLVDSINNIIDEPELELIDIIDLPIILFLSNPKPVILDSFIDNCFIDSDVNEEINHFSAEEVLNVVKTEVSIFENTVSDKKKKQGKNKKDKSNIIENITPTSLDIIKEDPLTINEKYDNNSDDNLELDNVLLHNTEIEQKIILSDMTEIKNNSELSSLEDSDLFSFHNRLEKTDCFIISINTFLEKVELKQILLIDSADNILEKTDCFIVPINTFLEKVELKQPLLIHSVEYISIIDFLLSAEIVDLNVVIEEFEPNFNFFEENKKKLIELSTAGNLDLIDDLYSNYPEFEKPLINFNYEGDNPVCIAAFYENLDLLKKLIDYGWDANYFDSNLNNALIIASAEGHKHIVRYLLTQNVQINFQNKIGYTALHFAVNDCNHRIVRLLLEAGADVEICDNDRNTALSIAAFKGDINSTKLLLQTRVNVHTKNKKGYDARSIALIAKNHAVAKLIEDKIISEKHNHSLPPIIEKTFEKNT